MGDAGELGARPSRAVVAFALPARMMSGFPLMGLSTRPRGNVVAQQLPLMGLSTRPGLHQSGGSRLSRFCSWVFRPRPCANLIGAAVSAEFHVAMRVKNQKKKKKKKKSTCVDTTA